nr:hypothetical protein [Tanacetum cinerariifolium]
MLNLPKNYRNPWRPNIWLRCINHLRIEESLRVQDSDKPKGNNIAGPSVVNMEHNNSSKYNGNKGKRNKKYFVTFIDDASRFCYVYLLHTKDEALDKFKGLGLYGSCKTPDPKLKTLGERGIKCIFVGYAEHSKAFRFYVIEPNDLVTINSITESRDAIFDENKFSSVPRPSLRIPNETKDIGGSVVPEEKEAINDEVDSIMSNNTWVFADLPPGCKWIFKRKLKMDGKTTFFNGDLDKEVYINQPQGFIIPSNENKVCKLIKKFDKSGKGVIVCLYVDDMLIFSTDQVRVDLTKKYLSSRFFMKDIGEDDVILGIRIKHESNEISISQSHYIDKDDWLLDVCMTCTRPDIAFAVGKLTRYTSNPVFEGYTDISWISNTEDNSSTSGWVFLLGSGVISWASKKQTCITGSTLESEFMALETAGKEAVWLKNFEIPLWSKSIAPISIRCDNAATLAKAYSQMYNGKSRHLGVRHSMIREPITNRVISIEFVRSQQNLADHLMKGLARDLVIKSAEGMRLKSN